MTDDVTTARSSGDACPISGLRVSAQTARINAIVAFGIAFTVAGTGLWALLALTVFDYALKVFAGFATSPLCWLVGRILDAAGVEHRMVDAAPKHFAATIGLAFNTGALILYAFGLSAPAFAAIAVFAACAGLDGFLGFCVGCKIYSLLPAGVRDAVRPRR